MISYDEFLQSPEFLYANEEARPLVMETYATDFWKEVMSDPDYNRNHDAEEWQQVRDQFDSMFPKGRYIRAELEGQDRGFKKGWESLKSGAKQAYGVVTGDSEMVAEEVAKQDIYERNNPGTPAGGEMEKAFNSGGDRPGVIGGVKNVLGGIAAVGKEFKKDVFEAPDIWSGTKAAWDNLAAFANANIEQLPNSAPGMTGTLAGGAAGWASGGPIGMILGSIGGGTVGNSVVEMRGKILQGLQEANINPVDRDAVAKWVSENQAQIITDTAQKSAVISVVDAITLAAGAKILAGPALAASNRTLAKMGVDAASPDAIKVAKSSPQYKALMAADEPFQKTLTGVNKLSRNVGAAALEPFGEAFGEYMGEKWSTGKQDMREAFLEGVFSMGTSAGVFAGQKTFQAIKAPDKPAVPEKPIGAATQGILATESVDEAIETFKAAVETPAMPTEELGVQAPVDQAIDEFTSNVRTGDQRVAERDIESILTSSQVPVDPQTYGPAYDYTINDEPGPPSAPVESIEERQAAIESAPLTGEEIRDRAGAEYIPSVDGDRLKQQADREFAYENQKPEEPIYESPEERRAVIKYSEPTEEEIRGKAGTAYTPSVDGDRLKKQAEIEEAFAPPPREEQRRSTKAETYETLANKEETPLDRKMDKVEEELPIRKAAGTAGPEIATKNLETQEVFEVKPADFTASNGKPFSNEKTLKWSAAQRKVSLEGMTVVPYKGGVIAVSKAAEKAPVRHDAAIKLENGHWEINGDKSTAKGQTVDLDATQPQKEAGNYKKAHVRINGLEISIENPIGSTRTGIAPDGSEWQTPMKADYGYIKGTVGKDKDHLDVFIKPKYRGGDGPVFVVNQVDPETGKFDEHKVVMGAKTEDEAMEIYESNYEKGWPGGKSVVPMTQEQFSSWSRSEAPRRGEVKPADLPKAPKAPKALPTVDLVNIPEDTMVQVKEITREGREQPVTKNAREALKEHGELIEKYSTLLGCIQS